MSRIDSSVQALLAQRPPQFTTATSLERLSTGVRVGGAGLRAPGDTASVSNTPGAAQSSDIARGGLNELAGLLEELDAIVASASDAGLSSTQRDANQQRVDAILRSVDRVASSRGLQGLAELTRAPRYSTTNVSPDVEQFAVYNADLGDSGALDVAVEVTQSAQSGGFLLSFGAANIDLGSAGETLTLEIAGVNGSRIISFSSGTDVDSIAEAINTFTDVTGVTASSDGTGRLDIRSDELGADQFVSIGVLDDGNISGGDGVYTLSANDTSEFSGAGATAFSAADFLQDFGQDVQGTINGLQAEGLGAELRLRSAGLTTRIGLGTGEAISGANAQTVGAFRAFTILSASQSLTDLGAGGTIDLQNSDLGAARSAIQRSLEQLSLLRDGLGEQAAAAPVATRGPLLEAPTSAARALANSQAESVLRLLR